jgi:DNA-binding SARP family transcriptional activator
MEFRILGPLEAVAAGRVVPLRGARQRAVLALLLLHSGETISVDRMVDEIWGDSPPPTAGKIAKNAISQLRTAIGHGDDVIRTEAGGYVLHLEPDALDAHRFEALVQDGRAALAAGDPRRAARTLNEALALWRGPPLADLAYESFVQTEAARIAEGRLAGLEARIDADLALGRHVELVPEIEALVREHPLRERPRAQLMLALYRSKRQAQALEVFQDIRRVLVDELGIDPGRELRDLHQAILQQAPELDLAVVDDVAPTAPTPPDAPVDLLEREGAFSELASCLAEARAGRGRVALVAAEAGGGKTAVVEAFCAEGAAGAEVLWGACDPLSTPRPLAPLLDMAQLIGGEFARRARDSGDRDALFDALLERLRAPGALHLLVFEDVHWADEATLDLLRVLGRRVGRMHTLIVVTYRDDELAPEHPLRTVLGDLATSSVVRRIQLTPLSAAAIAELAGHRGRDPQGLLERTGGNPFFLTEVLAGDPTDLPETVRDVVLARATRLSPTARRVLDAVAVVPARIERTLLQALAGSGDGLPECVSAGILVDQPEAVAFRHELARQAIEGALPHSARQELHGRVLVALEESDGAADPARLAHHAEAVGRADAVLRHAPVAAARAAELGAHREAAAQYARALRFGDHLPLGERTELLERYADECLLTAQVEQATEARRQSVDGRRAMGDRRGEGDGLVRLATCLWLTGHREESQTKVAEAITLLEPLEHGPGLAMAYSEMSRIRMLLVENDAAIDWGNRAIELAERLEATEVLVHALNNVGSAELAAGVASGATHLERSLRIAAEAGLEWHVARAYHNLSYFPQHQLRLDEAARWLEEGSAYCEEHELDSQLLRMRANLAELRVRQGRWDEALELGDWVLSRPEVAFEEAPLCARGLIRARRGEPDPWTPLDAALVLAESVGGLDILHPVACARAETAWISGDDDRAIAEVNAVLPLAQESGDIWYLGELASALLRAGAPLPELGALPEPYSLERGARWDCAAAAWEARGCPYEAALCLMRVETPDARRRAIHGLGALGAHAAAARFAGRSRARRSARQRTS